MFSILNPAAPLISAWAKKTWPTAVPAPNTLPTRFWRWRGLKTSSMSKAALAINATLVRVFCEDMLLVCVCQTLPSLYRIVSRREIDTHLLSRNKFINTLYNCFSSPLINILLLGKLRVISFTDDSL